MARYPCLEVDRVETVVCVVPNSPSSQDEQDLAHPDIENTFISPIGTDFLVDGWIYNSNPYHATQPSQGLPTGNYIVIN